MMWGSTRSLSKGFDLRTNVSQDSTHSMELLDKLLYRVSHKSLSPLFSHSEALLLYGTYKLSRKLNCVVAITTGNMPNNTNFLKANILMIESLINAKTPDSATWVSPKRARSTSRSVRGPYGWLKVAVVNERWQNACR